MKITRGKISKLPDGELLGLWRQTARSEYAAALMLRYAPFVYGALLDASGCVDAAKEDVAGFARRFPSLLTGYGASGAFSVWLYGALATFAAERYGAKHAGHKDAGVSTEVQRAYIKKLAGEDERAVAVFEEGAAGLSKPQRECMKRFFFERETFETISESTGYLTDKVRSYIEAGAAALTAEGGWGGLPDDGFTAAKYADIFHSYIKGERTGSDAYEVELGAMLDPFLASVVDGCLAVSGDHVKALADIDREVEAMYFQPAKSRTWLYVLAAVLIVAAAVAVYWCCFRAATPDAPVPVVEKPAAVAETPAVQSPGQDEPAGLSEAPVEGVVLSDEQPGKEIEMPEPEPEPIVSPVAETAPDVYEDTTQEYGPVRLFSVSEDENEPFDEHGNPNYVSMPKVGKRRYDEYLRRAAVKLDEDVKGDVTITFNVNRYGRPSQIRVVEFLSQEAHREAIRLLENGPEWSATDKQVTVVMRFE